MTLKEELEILRGEPIKVFDGDPMEIPCIETSDPEKLCKNPVVSVHMITYNHEPYIRQAIEGVMMQKTNFEFELVIGEDCSQDKTREICFEYQKKYPDKIRVLWWHENLQKVSHPAGGNGRRTTAHCRGEFIAFCEGDDYWIDQYKLQKQVDMMRKYPAVGLCITSAKVVNVITDEFRQWNETGEIHYGYNTGKDFVAHYLFGTESIYHGINDSRLVITASALFRQCALHSTSSRFDINKWKLRVGDIQTWLSIASGYDVYILQDVSVAYNINSTSISCRAPSALTVDGFMTRAYFMLKFYNRPIKDLPCYYKEQIFINLVYARLGQMQYFDRLAYLWKAVSSQVARHIIFNINMGWLLVLLVIGLRGSWLHKAMAVFIRCLGKKRHHPKWLLQMQYIHDEVLKI